MTDPQLSTRAASRLALLAALVGAPACALRAQSGPALRPTYERDAAVVARGELRLLAPTTWSRWDATAGSDGTRPLGAPLSSDSLPPRFPALVRTENGLRALLGDATLRVSPGRAETRASTRTVVTPVTLEYGLTRRVQLSAAISIVQTRTSVLALLDATAAGTNLGVNPARANATHLATDSTVAAQLASAATALGSRLSQCRASPAAAGCGPILADSAAVRQLAENAATASNVVGTVYGAGADADGEVLVPLANNPLHQAVVARIDVLSTQIQQYLGAGAAITQRPVGAAGVGGQQELLALVSDPRTGIGGTLGTVDHYGTGDVELGAALQLLDRWQGLARRWRTRALVSGLVRLPTGFPADSSRLLDIGTGEGQTSYEGALLADVLLRDRYGLSGAARYTARTGTVGSGAAALLERTGQLPQGLVPTSRRPGNLLQLDLAARLLVAQRLGVGLHYGLLHRADDEFAAVGSPDVADAPYQPAFRAGGATEHRAGIGFRYTTLATGNAPRPRLPFDVSYVHLETLGASGGPAPKLRRDQLQVRLYYQLLARRR